MTTSGQEFEGEYAEVFYDGQYRFGKIIKNDNDGCMVTFNGKTSNDDIITVKHKDVYKISTNIRYVEILDPKRQCYVLAKIIQYQTTGALVLLLLSDAKIMPTLWASYLQLNIIPFESEKYYEFLDNRGNKDIWKICRVIPNNIRNTFKNRLIKVKHSRDERSVQFIDSAKMYNKEKLEEFIINKSQLLPLGTHLKSYKDGDIVYKNHYSMNNNNSIAKPVLKTVLKCVVITKLDPICYKIKYKLFNDNNWTFETVLYDEIFQPTMGNVLVNNDELKTDVTPLGGNINTGLTLNNPNSTNETNSNAWINYYENSLNVKVQKNTCNVNTSPYLINITTMMEYNSNKMKFTEQISKLNDIINDYKSKLNNLEHKYRNVCCENAQLKFELNQIQKIK